MTSRTHYAYWGLTTAAFCLFMAFSGLGDLTSSKVIVSDLLQLGYPAYLAPMLGVAALLTPGLPRLKEWAYAGFSFDLIGAIVSALTLRILDSDVALASIALILLVAVYSSYRLAEGADVAPGLIHLWRTRPVASDVAR